jgi:hypothetical protein
LVVANRSPLMQGLAHPPVDFDAAMFARGAGIDCHVLPPFEVCSMASQVRSGARPLRQSALPSAQPWVPIQVRSEMRKWVSFGAVAGLGRAVPVSGERGAVLGADGVVTVGGLPVPLGCAVPPPEEEQPATSTTATRHDSQTRRTW